jgi:hypothetical protein
MLEIRPMDDFESKKHTKMESSQDFIKFTNLNLDLIIYSNIDKFRSSQIAYFWQSDQAPGDGESSSTSSTTVAPWL